MKPILRIIMSLIGLSMMCFPLFGQDNSIITINNNGTTDSTAVSVKGLPPLVPPISARPDTPSYSYFYIYGDGDFDMFTKIGNEGHASNHLYPATLQTGQQQQYTARAYGIGVYGNGKPPPRRLKSTVFGGHNSNVGAAGEEIARIVDTLKFVKLLPHAQAKMGEPLVYLLAFHNPLNVPIQNAELFLFFESEMREKIKKEDGSLTLMSIAEYGKFPVQEVLIHNNKTISTSNLYGASLPASSKYKHALAFNIFNLQPHEEKHIFLEFMVDSSMFKVFNPKHKASVNFTAVLVSQDTTFSNANFITNNESDFLFKNGLGNLNFTQVFPDTVLNYIASNDSTAIFTNSEIEFSSISGLGTVLGVDNSSITLVKGHDPNFLEAVGCDCPNNGGRNKMIITIHAENDGQGTVHDIYFDMELPNGLSAADIVGEPIAHHPFIETDSVKSIDFIDYKVIDDKHIRWHFSNLEIYPVEIYGTGHEYTYAELTFAAFTDVAPSSFDSILFTCIRFGDLTEEAVCTYPVDVTLLKASTTDITCGTCENDPNPEHWWDNIPWWLWLIIALVLLWLLIRRLF